MTTTTAINPPTGTQTDTPEELTEFDSPSFIGATAASSIAISTFDQAYTARPPWDIDGPQPSFARLLDSGLVTGRVLDLGCGTGESALHYASRGLDVTGLDASAVAIHRAHDKARQRGLSIRFIHADALQLAELGETFDTVTDSGLLHVLSDQHMTQLIAGVHAVLRPGGHYWLLCFSEHATGNGPRKLTKQRIATLFEHGWTIQTIEPAHFHTLSGRGHDQDTAAGWLAHVQRQ